jgi:hypothetical protein
MGLKEFFVFVLGQGVERETPNNYYIMITREREIEIFEIKRAMELCVKIFFVTILVKYVSTAAVL